MNSPVIIFDGVCNFCNGSINFIIKQDKKRRFRFAALQSSAGQKLLEQHHLPKKSFNSFVLIDDGKVYLKSSAGLRIYGQLAWYWKWTKLFWLVPPFIRNGLYDVVARHRYKWFGKRDSCMLPSAEVRSRFL